MSKIMRYANWAPDLSFNWADHVGEARDKMVGMYMPDGRWCGMLEQKDCLHALENLTDISDINKWRQAAAAVFVNDAARRDRVDFLYWYLINRNLGIDFMKCSISYPGQQTLCMQSANSGILPEIILDQQKNDQERTDQLKQLTQPTTPVNIGPVIRWVGIFAFVSLFAGLLIWFFKSK